MSETWEKLKKILGFGPDCKNDGTKLLSGDCMCQENFSGKLCETIICRNNGKPNRNNTSCICPDTEHYRGIHCEQLLCENGGLSTKQKNGDRMCDCLDNWYSGAYCESYSSPWGIIFGVMAGVLIFLVIGCVLCRLYPCKSRNRRRSRSRSNSDAESADNRSGRNRNRRSRDGDQSSRGTRGRPVEIRAIPGVHHSSAAGGHRNNRSNAPRGGVGWPPWPPNAQLPVPIPDSIALRPPGDLPAEDLAAYLDREMRDNKFAFPPPSYEEVIRDENRYPVAPPSFAAAISTQENHGRVNSRTTRTEGLAGESDPLATTAAGTNSRILEAIQNEPDNSGSETGSSGIGRSEHTEAERRT